MKLTDYSIADCYDELFQSAGEARNSCSPLVEHLRALDVCELTQYQQAADLFLRNSGITFNVYGHADGTERVWPFDVVPRIIGSTEWSKIESGLKQRIDALNCFVQDVYNDARILTEGVVPEHLIFSSKSYREQCRGLQPPHSTWCHITGSDVVRDANGDLYVLEDNLRCPSGVSYVLTNRDLMKRVFTTIFRGMSIAPVEEYPDNLLRTLTDCAPAAVENPTVVLLTPGVFNAAYFEHTYLAQQMGIELVEGSDLVVDGGYVCMKTTSGLRRVDVIYRRIDDDFLDPKCFRSDSALGVDHLMDVYRAGNVNIANAPGVGIADDKAIYPYVPDIIRFYLGEEAIIKNVPTFSCAVDKEKNHVLANLNNLVVKPTNESGGYGILMGPMSTQQQRDECAASIHQNPREWIAQPMLNLSTAPTLVNGSLQPRHVDLRPFILRGKDTYVMKGGLTRVALVEGSMIVNSSQGGGSKDTWVLADHDCVPQASVQHATFPEAPPC